MSLSVESAIANAARATGVGVDYLRSTAARESSFDPQAQASTSSAAGLFQFIESTWLDTLKTHGPALGLGAEAAQASAPDGRAAALDLRFDPEIAALMAGALTRENADSLERAIGRPASTGELYAAHFLGAGDAARLITLAQEQPSASAVDAFPAAAAANPTVFRTAQGAPQTAAGLLARLTETRDATPAAATPGPAMQDLPPSRLRRLAGDQAGAGAGGVRAPLLLSSALVEILASLEAPARAQASSRET